jgi:polyisoprenoid-binding protein YceI
MAEQTATIRNVNGTDYPAVGTFDIDVSHTRVGFAVRHMAVSKVRGEFKDFSGTLELAEDPTASKISVTVQAASVDTHDENRDNHLRTNDFFDVENHPTWSFTSTAIHPVSDSQWKVDGDLTIRGVTKQVTLDATLEGVVQDPYGMHRVGFSATTSIVRDDFGVSFNAALETGGVVVGKKVDIDLELEATLRA